MLFDISFTKMKNNALSSCSWPKYDLNIDSCLSHLYSTVLSKVKRSIGTGNRFFLKRNLTTEGTKQRWSI